MRDTWSRPDGEGDDEVGGTLGVGAVEDVPLEETVERLNQLSLKIAGLTDIAIEETLPASRP